MRLRQDQCWEALSGARHGILATVNPRRGVDAVPVVFAVVAGPPPMLVIPVDTVKPKRSPRLQRLVNLENDPRCVLLVDHYDDDWSRLWWVRVHARATTGAPTGERWGQLAERYPQYREPGSVVKVVTLAPTEVTGWRGDGVAGWWARP